MYKPVILSDSEGSLSEELSPVRTEILRLSAQKDESNYFNPLGTFHVKRSRFPYKCETAAELNSVAASLWMWGVKEKDMDI